MEKGQIFVFCFTFLYLFKSENVISTKVHVEHF